MDSNRAALVCWRSHRREKGKSIEKVLVHIHNMFRFEKRAIKP